MYRCRRHLWIFARSSYTSKCEYRTGQDWSGKQQIHIKLHYYVALYGVCKSPVSQHASKDDIFKTFISCSQVLLLPAQSRNFSGFGPILLFIFYFREIKIRKAKQYKTTSNAEHKFKTRCRVHT